MGLFGKSKAADPKEQVNEWCKKIRKEQQQPFHHHGISLGFDSLCFRSLLVGFWSKTFSLFLNHAVCSIYICFAYEGKDEYRRGGGGGENSSRVLANSVQCQFASMS